MNKRKGNEVKPKSAPRPTIPSFPNTPSRSVPGGRLLRVGGDLNGELHAALEGIPRPLIHGLHALDVDAADDEAVGGEAQGGA